MKIIFVNVRIYSIGGFRHPRHFLPPLSIGYSASLLDQIGCETILLDNAADKLSPEQIINYVKEKKPDILVLNPGIKVHQIVLEIAGSVKRYVKYIVVLGPFASLLPELFIFKDSPIDVCVFGESEFTLLEFVKKIINKNNFFDVDGIIYFANNRLVRNNKRDLIKNLDSLPFPKHSFFVNKRYSFYYPVNTHKRIKMGYMLSSRGCPYSCIFCSPIERVSYSHEYRIRSAENIVAEMQLLEKMGINTVYFVDDLFARNEERIDNLCDKIIDSQLQIKWIAQIRVDILNSERLLRKMKKAGCSTLCLGIEAGTDRILNILSKDINKKQISKTIKGLKKTGIWVVGFFIIGSPTETEKDMKETLKFAKQLLPELIQVGFFTPYPGSKAFEFAGKRENVECYSKHEGDSYFNQPSIKNFQKKFYRDFYFNPFFIIDFIFKQGFYHIINLDKNIKLFKLTYRFLKKL